MSLFEWRYIKDIRVHVTYFSHVKTKKNVCKYITFKLQSLYANSITILLSLYIRCMLEKDMLSVINLINICTSISSF